MNDADFILYNQWIRSPEYLKAFEAWKQGKLASCKNTVPFSPFENVPTPNPNLQTIPVRSVPEYERNSSSGFSGQDWERHVDKCKLSGRDPYD